MLVPWLPATAATFLEMNLPRAPNRADSGRMTSRPIVVYGQEYLGLATALLERMRLASPTGGIWEAADVQWWSRTERRTDADGQLFWLADGEAVAAVVRTEFGDSVQCDVHAGPGADARAVWAEALRWAEELREARDLGAAAVAAEFPVRDDDATGIAAVTAADYRPDSSGGVVASWLPAASRPPVPPIPEGFRLLSRADEPGEPHPMATPNGPDVGRRLLGCSLYRRDLDLRVLAPDGQLAGYGLFWPDPVTGVGLVEPMRTEDVYQRRGIASHLLATGLDRLAQCGCDSLKVCSDIPFYLRAGFRPLPSAAAAVYTARS